MRSVLLVHMGEVRGICSTFDRVDYCNAILVGINYKIIRQQQTVLHADARLVPSQKQARVICNVSM